MLVRVKTRIVNTFHRLGGALGVAVLSTVAADGTTDGTTGVTPAFTVGAVVTSAAAVLSAFGRARGGRTRRCGATRVAEPRTRRASATQRDPGERR